MLLKLLVSEKNAELVSASLSSLHSYESDSVAEATIQRFNEITIISKFLLKLTVIGDIKRIDVLNTKIQEIVTEKTGAEINQNSIFYHFYKLYV